MTPPFMYYSVAWVWLEYLTRGVHAAEGAMSKCLGLVQPKTTPTTAGEANDLFPERSGSFGLRGTLAGKYVMFHKKHDVF